MFLCLINISNSLFVLILHIPSLSFLGQKIFLNTLLYIKCTSILREVQNIHPRPLTILFPTRTCSNINRCFEIMLVFNSRLILQFVSVGMCLSLHVPLHLFVSRLFSIPSNQLPRSQMETGCFECIRFKLQSQCSFPNADINKDHVFCVYYIPENIVIKVQYELSLEVFQGILSCRYFFPHFYLTFSHFYSSTVNSVLLSSWCLTLEMVGPLVHR